MSTIGEGEREEDHFSTLPNSKIRFLPFPMCYIPLLAIDSCWLCFPEPFLNYKYVHRRKWPTLNKYSKKKERNIPGASSEQELQKKE